MPKHSRKRSRSPKRQRKNSRSPEHRSRDEKHKSRCEFSSNSRDHKSLSNHGRKKEFSFEDYKEDLDCLFFTHRNIIKKDSAEYEDFWKFYGKYVNMQKKQGVSWIPPKAELPNELGIPKSFHRFFMLNFNLDLPPPEKLLSQLPQKGADDLPQLTRHNLMEFHQIILLYLEFLQREKLQKLKKLRESQEKLPIAQFQEEIVKAVSTNQVVIIAGISTLYNLNRYLLYNFFWTKGTLVVANQLKYHSTFCMPVFPELLALNQGE